MALGSWTMSMKRLARRLGMVSILVGIAGCGGGGDDDAEASVAVDLAPSTITITSQVGVVVQDVTVRATLRPKPTSDVYAIVVADSPAFATGATTVYENNAGYYTAFLRIARGLPVGKYSGTLRLRLCRDAACASEYTLVGGTLPYSVEIVPVKAFDVGGG